MPRADTLKPFTAANLYSSWIHGVFGYDAAPLTRKKPRRVPIREIDPLRDRAWLQLVARDRRASVFHTPGWLEALRRTYGYEPVVLAITSTAGEVTGGAVFCRVSSWLTGRRMVSLPFSDHCEPLVRDNNELGYILTGLRDQLNLKGWKYLEMRPAEVDLGADWNLNKSKTFSWHRLDLRQTLDALFRGFHPDCIQRKIRRAEREGLLCEEGRSEGLLERFYRLLVMTRRKHLLLPPPFAWLRNLVACVGDNLKIRLASADGRPVAGILTLTHNLTLTYKYGCSDARYHRLGGTQLLLWKAIQDARGQGLEALDMGRSDWENTGLIKFKDRWGAARSTLTYWRLGSGATDFVAVTNTGVARQVFKHLSDDSLIRAGKLLYRHVA